jgi:3',5'-cyclic AMP phosphodiesterase CpdA
VFSRLANVIGRLKSGGLSPDLVAITGDLAKFGTREDYGAAQRWSDETLLPALGNDSGGFPKEHLLLVPGNHDVDRREVGQLARYTQFRRSLQPDCCAKCR